jgi:hypothetical protein
MGMFDSIYLNIKCPYCGKESEMEAQTKELESELQVWKKGDSIGTDKYNYLVCIADCHSDECMEHELKRVGYRSGFGRGFDVKIFIDKGIVTGDYEIVETW